MKQTLTVQKGEDNLIRVFGYRQEDNIKYYFGVNYARDFQKKKVQNAQELLDEN